MYLLDTDHLTLLERGGAGARPILSRLASVAPDDVATTIVSYEEQTRGWMSYMAQARSLEQQVVAYERLQQHLAIFALSHYLRSTTMRPKSCVNCNKCRFVSGQ